MFAKSANIELRYDVVAQGIGQLMDYLGGDPSIASHTRAGLWTFSSAINNPVPMTSNLGIVKRSFPAPEISQGYSNTLTQFDLYVDQLISIIGRGGDGSSANSAKKLLILSTDGVSDIDPLEPFYMNLIGQFNMSFCETLKSKNVEVAIVYTPYLPLPQSDYYNATLARPGNFSASRATDVPIVFKKCAGDLMVTANDAASLRSGFQTVYTQSLQSQETPVRLSQ